MKALPLFPYFLSPFFHLLVNVFSVIIINYVDLPFTHQFRRDYLARHMQKLSNLYQSVAIFLNYVLLALLSRLLKYIG